MVEAKVVLNENGVSKRFGFVTFTNKDDVTDLIKNRTVEFQHKWINVGPAVKKNVRIFFKSLLNNRRSNS